MNDSMTLLDFLKVFYYSFGFYWLLGSLYELYLDKKLKRDSSKIYHAKNAVILVVGLVLNQIIFVVLSLFITDKKILLGIFFAFFWIVFYVLNLKPNNSDNNRIG